ncbi:MAG: peptidase [Cyclobacteriaceae bacterium]
MIRILFLSFLSLHCYAQSQLPIPTNFQHSYLNSVRDLSGKPGINYWQNSADYSIKVNFSPDTREIAGYVKIQYYNNSPDTLSKIVFKLFPNLYQSESIRAKRIPKEDLGDGVSIAHINLNGVIVEPEMISILGTNMTVKGTRILPQDEVTIDIKYSYTLNQGSFIRTGQVDPGAFVIAYFFPRITVYDDIDGWNEYPYMGFEEFYNDYGDFHVEITVPDNYQVWCTGDLTNITDVYTDKYEQRIQNASSQDGVIDIITKEDLIKNDICKRNGKNTWKFDAINVQDVAFATSNHYIWKSTSIVVDSVQNRRVRINAVYNPEHTQYDPVVGYARSTVSIISYTYPKIPFPYPHITIFEGLDAMEYPMMVNNLPFKDPLQIVQFTAHEVFHTLFPFYVGTNETKYSFMDEGLATMTEFTLPQLIAPDVPMYYDLDDVNLSAGSDYDNPIITLTPQLNRNSRYSNKDLKPALGFYYVKEMLGDDKFSETIKYFINH